MDKMDWTKTQAVWDGEDWRFTEVPLEACPSWGGRTCFNRTELNYDGADPVKAVDALMYWCEYGESQPNETVCDGCCEDIDYCRCDAIEEEMSSKFFMCEQGVTVSGRVMWAYVYAPEDLIRTVLMQSTTPSPQLYSGHEVSLFTGAKLYWKEHYCRWYMNGYSQDDVSRVLKQLSNNNQGESK